MLPDNNEKINSELKTSKETKYIYSFFHLGSFWPGIENTNNTHIVSTTPMAKSSQILFVCLFVL